MIEETVYKHTASLIHALMNCKESNNQEWENRHYNSLVKLANDFLPSGSGIDSGCQINLDESTPDKIILNSAYHAMDEDGFYCGWIHFSVVVTSSLEFDINIEFTNIQNDSDLDEWESDSLFDYLYDTFDYTLRQMI